VFKGLPVALLLVFGHERSQLLQVCLSYFNLTKKLGSLPIRLFVLGLQAIIFLLTHWLILPCCGAKQKGQSDNGTKAGPCGCPRLNVPLPDRPSARSVGSVDGE